jgi:hypothetical protein
MSPTGPFVLLHSASGRETRVNFAAVITYEPSGEGTRLLLAVGGENHPHTGKPQTLSIWVKESASIIDGMIAQYVGVTPQKRSNQR